MQLRTQIFIILLILLFIAYILREIFKTSLDYKYAFVWLTLGFIILVFAVFPSFPAQIAIWLNIGLPLNLLFFFGILISLFMIFSLATSYSKQKLKLYRLIQLNGLLDYTVRDLSDRIAVLEKRENKID